MAKDHRYECSIDGMEYLQLWGHVEGTATLREGASNEDKEKFDHDAVRAHAMIVRTLSKQVTSMVLRCNNSKEVWKKLSEEFEVKTLQNTMILRTGVNRMRLKEGGSVKEHIFPFHVNEIKYV